MPRVVIVQEHLPHYREKFFDLLHTQMETAGIHLDLVYSPHVSASLLAGHLPWAIPVPTRRWKHFAWQNALKLCHGADLVIVQQESKYVVNYVLQILSLFNKQKIAFWGHGRNFQSENANILGEEIKKRASRFCDWWFAYNDMSVKIVQNLGFPLSRITSVQNSIDTHSIADARQRTSPDQLVALKAKLGISSTNIGVFTGGLYREKRLPFLIEACELIRASVPDFELIVIGKGPEADFIEDSARKYPWIHFVGPKSDVEKVPYWMISKLLLMPGLVGLVVLDSFSLGVPMITTDYPYHSPEISYLQDGINGVIVKPWPDVEEYAKRAIALFHAPEKITNLSRNALAAAKQYSVERMSQCFADGIISALDAPKISRTKMLFAPPAPIAGENENRIGVVVRSLAPYLRDFYDNLTHSTDGTSVKIFIGQRGTDWVNPWDVTLMNLRRADHVYVNAKTKGRTFRTIFPTRELFNALERYTPGILLITEYSPLSIFGAIWATIHRLPWVIATDIGPDYKPPYPRLTFSQKIVHSIANRFCSGILALTPSAAKKAKRLGKPHILCPHAINTNVYTPGAKRVPSEKIRIIVVGNFIPRKGYDLLFKALAELPTAQRDSWTLHCFGAGSPHELHQLASQLNIVSKIHFSAFIGLDQLIEAYQQSDFFVLPSRSDTFGVVVHEAASCGLPVLVSRHSGASEVLVEEGVNGYVIVPEDTEQFSDYLSRMIRDSSMRERFSHASRAIAEKWDVRINASRALTWLNSEFTQSSNSTPIR